MTMLIEHIDRIARMKQRDVVYLTFASDWMDFDNTWETDENHPRNIITKFFDENDIKWTPCGNPASETGFSAYQGQIYIDIPYDVTNPKYIKVQQFLEDENENIKPEFGKTHFYYVPLSLALTNAHHDEPGYWEKWAETF